MSPQLMAHQAYSQAFHTVGKTRQVVMLYDGAIRFIKQAKEAIRENRIEDRFNLLVRSSEVILGLQSCLDFENGDHVARVLYDFYSSVDARILTIQRTNDQELCDELIEELKEMRDAWEAIDNDRSADETAPAAASPQPGTHDASPYAAAEAAGSGTGEEQQQPPAIPLSNDITV